MSQQRKTKKRMISAGVVLKTLVTAAIVAACGLSYVEMTTQIQRVGSEIGKLERDLASLKMQRSVVDVQIATLSSRTALRQKLAAGVVKMIPIAEASIVRLNPNLFPANRELRVVSNQEISR